MGEAPVPRRTVRSLFLPGPAGKLEALLELPADAEGTARPASALPLAGLVCHPHPLYGGTLHNKVVHHISLAMQSRFAGPVLRFNFRGAGRSQGKHDHGRGEGEDVRAGLHYLEKEFPERGVVLAGFSFGAWVGLRVGCEDSRVRALIGVGLPANSNDLSYLGSCPMPKLFVQGSRDPYGSRAAVEAVVKKAANQKELIWIEGADHFFSGYLAELRQAILDHFPLRE